MDRFLLVALLTAVIHLIGTLVYVARFSGVKTKRLATAFSLYQVISLLAMTANMVQAPLLSLTVEQGINTGQIYKQAYLNGLESNIRYIIVAASVGTAAAGMFAPFFSFLFNRTIHRLGGADSSIVAYLTKLAAGRKRTWAKSVPTSRLMMSQKVRCRISLSCRAPVSVWSVIIAVTGSTRKVSRKTAIRLTIPDMRVAVERYSGVRAPAKSAESTPVVQIPTTRILMTNSLAGKKLCRKRTAGEVPLSPIPFLR
jgi:hypothetical protein